MNDGTTGLTPDSLAQASTTVLDEDRHVDPELARLARRAAADGAVLLRNGGTLPLATDARVALFGRVQIDYFTVGYGSGGDVNAPYSWNLLDGLRDAGVAVDAELAAVYTDWSAAHRPDPGEWGTWPRSFDEMPLDDTLVAAAAERTDLAVVVIGRAAGESRDNTLEQGSFLLTDDERTMLTQVTAAFDRVVLVLDIGSTMDLSWLEEDFGRRIDAVLLAWQGGMESGRAVADLLTGTVSPSGRLTDSVALSYPDYPTAGNFGHPDVNVYAEDIYVGYRFFQTFAPERVQFPFGFGLGYTTFDLTDDGSTVQGETATVRTRVTNTGDRPGRHTVQVYAARPQGALGQPLLTLAAFGKTGELAPGDSTVVTLTVDLAELASYDDSGSTGHRHAWVLEAGEYALQVGADVRDAGQRLPVATFTVDDTRVVQQLRQAIAPDPAHPFVRMRPTAEDGSFRVTWEETPTSTVDRAERITADLPTELTPTGARLTLADVAAGRATVEELVADLSPIELEALTRGDYVMDSKLGAPGNAGVLGGTIESLRARGIAAVTTTDGPSGIRLSAYASLLPCGTALAATWDPELVQALATAHGAEMVAKGSDILLSPGMNIHRDPLCGRNFEYLSEDPLVTGRIAGAIVRGIQANGVAACPKHFAANNQEENRNRNDSRVSERALREIYLRGFQIVVTEARPQTIMTSYNKINGVWAHYHHDLVTTVLREEWGYTGLVMTDWWMQPATDPDFPALTNDAYRVRAQVDVLMPGGADFGTGHGDGSLLASLDQEDGITLAEVQRTAVNVVRFVLGSRPVRDGRV
ncbi:glycoside hydrolase family 3 protein [Cellulomonas taurus]|uniref:glycoside hydrolase family 3 protein n=1 Tax=Cellulomonas taurus TaxID=2729175 RepID=UPI00145F7C06|nr:glycoside hydrolase family 3 protein [Cellulomonas taurus]